MLTGEQAIKEVATTPRGMRTFLIIWLGELISILGSGLTSFALGVWIFQQTGQATPFALTVLFGNLPRILLAPLAGSLADRWNRRWLMILADTGDALVTLVVVFLVAAGQLQVWNIYLIALCESAFAAFQEPAYTASVTLLVPKKELGRASGMMQMGQALEMLVSPLLAGVLFGLIGLPGIILIDFVTYFFAVGALLIVHIPQPETIQSPDVAKSSRKGNFLSDAAYGWQYLRARNGLFGLLWYFALVNFLLNFAGVLVGPLVLSTNAPAALGAVDMALGAGMLIGSVVMSVWGGPQRRILGVIGFIALASLGLLLTGLRPSAVLNGAGLFLLMFCIPLASGSSQAIFQSKVAPGVQGRVFAMRSMISRSMMPLAYLLTGPLADRVFEPLMRTGGALARTFAGAWLGAGPGRGMGLMFVLSGLVLMAASGLAFANPHIRRIEHDLPDVIGETPAGASEEAAEPIAGQASQAVTS
jgi:DHA3 family macrolide efflux protein-like MFS transporter